MLDFLNTVKNSPQLLDFIEQDLTNWSFVGLAFGFAILLLEIRLPLKYYWDLPIFTIKKFFRHLILRKEQPVWGYCLDAETNQIIPLTAIELLDTDSKEVIKTTFSNRLGQYGFLVRPGKFILRAIKNHYRMPPIFDAENIELLQVDESFALPVEFETEPPQVNLKLQPLEKYDPLDPAYQAKHFFKTFALNLANGFLVLSILFALFAWWLLTEPLYGVIIAIGIIFLFIKLYILETVSTAASLQKTP